MLKARYAIDLVYWTPWNNCHQTKYSNLGNTHWPGADTVDIAKQEGLGKVTINEPCGLLPWRRILPRRYCTDFAADGIEAVVVAYRAAAGLDNWMRAGSIGTSHPPTETKTKAIK